MAAVFDPEALFLSIVGLPGAVTAALRDPEQSEIVLDQTEKLFPDPIVGAWFDEKTVAAAAHGISRAELLKGLVEWKDQTVRERRDLAKQIKDALAPSIPFSYAFRKL